VATTDLIARADRLEAGKDCSQRDGDEQHGALARRLPSEAGLRRHFRFWPKAAVCTSCASRFQYVSKSSRPGSVFSQVSVNTGLNPSAHTVEERDAVP
jgi:hypothetical protein